MVSTLAFVRAPLISMSFVTNYQQRPSIVLTAALGLILMATVSGCAKSKSASVNAAPTLHADLPYIPGSKLKSQTLDLFLPGNVSQERVPVVVWIHGGAWEGGDKRPAPCPELIKRGIAVAAINYRLSSEAPFPAQIHDCKAAVRYLRANATKYNLNPDKIGVWGMSSGGHLASLLGTSGGERDLEGVEGDTEQSSKVMAVCDWCGFVDFEHIPKKGWNQESVFYKLFKGPQDSKQNEIRLASPMAFASVDDPPFLIMHGDKDRTVSIRQSENFKKALDKAGVRCDFEVVKEGDHFFFGPAQLTRTAEWFEEQFKPYKH